MNIEQALKTHLENQAALTALLGDGKLYYVTGPQKVVAPYLIMTKLDSERTHSHSGGSHFAKSRFEFAIFANTYKECKDIAIQLQTILQGARGTLGDSPGVKVYSIIYQDEGDSYNSETEQFVLAVDYLVQHYD